MPQLCRNCDLPIQPYPHRCYKLDGDDTTFSVALPPKAWANLKRLAELAGVSVEEAVIRLLNSYMEKL